MVLSLDPKLKSDHMITQSHDHVVTWSCNFEDADVVGADVVVAGWFVRPSSK